MILYPGCLILPLMSKNTDIISELRTYYLHTFGCQMNEYDSELIAWLLEQKHYIATPAADDADVVIFNTCCIRDKADQKVYARLGEFKRTKALKPDQILVVAGCLAQKDGERFIERFPQVDVVVGTHNLQDIPSLIDSVRSGNKPLVKVDREGDHFTLPAAPRTKYRAMVTISMGCNQWCTFCIVPYVRGKLKSRPKEQIVSEVNRLTEEGYQEILLLGQNVNDYGRDLGLGYDFSHLLRELAGIRRLRRLRFTSPHPAYFSDEVIQAMVDNPSVCEHVHLPLQAGDDAVLKRMRRGYTADEFLELLDKMRTAIPNLSVTTDIIVGFPGETEAQFQRTLEVVKQARFTSAFMFAFSPRPGTPGSLFKDQIPHEVKMDRLHRLIELQNSISMQENKQLLGEVFEVLVEGVSKKDHRRLSGRTRCNRLVHFPVTSKEDLTGKLIEVRLDEAYTWGFVGSPIADSPDTLSPEEQCRRSA